MTRDCYLAERGGFEPPVPLLGAHTISSRAPSTARSPLPKNFTLQPMAIKSLEATTV